MTRSEMLEHTRLRIETLESLCEWRAFIDRDFTSDTFNFNPFNFFQRPDERYTVGSFINYEFNRHFDAYAELSFITQRT